MNFETAVQQVVFNALNGTISCAVYDHVPQDEDAFPFAVIGADKLEDWSTDTELGAKVAATISVWSRELGRAEVKGLQSEIYEALNRADLNSSEIHIVDCFFFSSETGVDDDGITRFGNQVFHLLGEEV